MSRRETWREILGVARPRDGAAREPAWDRFWFAPEPTSTLALIRIAFGLLVTVWTVSLIPDLYAFFGEEGVYANGPTRVDPGVWNPLGWWRSDTWLLIVFLVLLVAGITLTLGLFTRVSAVLVFLGLMAFSRRNLWVHNSGDGLIRIMALFLALAPAGASLSLDRLRKARDRFWEFPSRAPVALRLMQLQLSLLYFSTVWQKVRGETWNDGTAVSYAMRIADIERFAPPAFVTDSVLLANVMTFGTLLTELSIAILVWNRKARPWILLVGVGFHFGIDLTIRVGLFSFALYVLYLSFLNPNVASRLILAVRDRFSRARAAPAVTPPPRQVEPVG